MSNHEEHPDDLSGLSDEQLAALFAAENAEDSQVARAHRDEAIVTAPVTVRHDDEEYTFSVVDPQNYLQVEQRGPQTAYVENLQVDDEYLRRGLARRMLEGAAVTLQEDGITELTSNSWTPVALRTIKNVFGEEAIDVFDAQSPEATENPGFAMTVEQAAQSSEMARAYNEEHPDAELPTLMGATIHLDRVNLEDIPRPEER